VKIFVNIHVIYKNIEISKLNYQIKMFFYNQSKACLSLTFESHFARKLLKDVVTNWKYNISEFVSNEVFEIDALSQYTFCDQSHLRYSPFRTCRQVRRKSIST